MLIYFFFHRGRNSATRRYHWQQWPRWRWTGRSATSRRYHRREQQCPPWWRTGRGCSRTTAPWTADEKFRSQRRNTWFVGLKPSLPSWPQVKWTKVIDATLIHGTKHAFYLVLCMHIYACARKVSALVLKQYVSVSVLSLTHKQQLLYELNCGVFIYKKRLNCGVVIWTLRPLLVILRRASSGRQRRNCAISSQNQPWMGSWGHVIQWCWSRRWCGSGKRLWRNVGVSTYSWGFTLTKECCNLLGV